MNLSQSCGIVPLAENDSIASAFTCDGMDMRRYNHATVICLFGDDTAGTGNFYLYGGATDAATTTALTFDYRWSSAALGSATADTFGAFSSGTVASIAATRDDVLLVAEVDASAMQSGTTQYDFLTPYFDGSNSAGTVTVIAILSEPRYKKDVMLTAIPA